MHPPVPYSSIPKLWTDATVYLIGGGPSLNNFDWNLLRDKHVIAINRAYEVAPFAEVLYWTDHQFYRWHKPGIDAFEGLKITCRPIRRTPHENILFVRGQSRKGLELRNNFVCHGNNSGYGAINLAIHLGATRIVLLGYDMQAESSNTHWHDGYPRRHNNDIYNRIIPYFESLIVPLEELGVEVINANLRSRLNCFSQCSIEEALGLEHIPEESA